MSIYKGDPAPIKRSARERLDHEAPLFYEPTYERSDGPVGVELLHWAVVVLIFVCLVLVFQAANSAVPSTDADPYGYDVGDSDIGEYVPDPNVYGG